jgi:hypothetical protein
MTSEDTEDLASAVVICKVRKLVRLLGLLVVTSYKSPINAITSQNPVPSH